MNQYVEALSEALAAEILSRTRKNEWAIAMLATNRAIPQAVRDWIAEECEIADPIVVVIRPLAALPPTSA